MPAPATLSLPELLRHSCGGGDATALGRLAACEELRTRLRGRTDLNRAAASLEAFSMLLSVACASDAAPPSPLPLRKCAFGAIASLMTESEIRRSALEPRADEAVSCFIQALQTPQLAEEAAGCVANAGDVPGMLRTAPFLLAALGTAETDPTTAASAAGALWNVAASPGGREAICDGDASPQSPRAAMRNLVILARHSDKAAVRMPAVGALRNLAAHPVCRAAALEAGAVDALLGVANGDAAASAAAGPMRRLAVEAIGHLAHRQEVSDGDAQWRKDVADALLAYETTDSREKAARRWAAGRVAIDRVAE